MTAIIDGQLAATLRDRNFRPSKPRPDTVWVRGRRASSGRVVAILDPDGDLTLHRVSAHRNVSAQLRDAAVRTADEIERAVLSVVRG